MKNVILGLALVGLAFGCKTDKQAAISDASATPAADCAAACEAKGKTCTEAEKAGCSEAAKKECAKTCPMTGKTIE